MTIYIVLNFNAAARHGSGSEMKIYYVANGQANLHGYGTWVHRGARDHGGAFTSDKNSTGDKTTNTQGHGRGPAQQERREHSTTERVQEGGHKRRAQDGGRKKGGRKRATQQETMSGEWHSNSGEELDAVHVLAQPCAAVGLVLEEVTLSAPMLAKGLDEVPPTRFMSVHK